MQCPPHPSQYCRALHHRYLAHSKPCQYHLARSPAELTTTMSSGRITGVSRASASKQLLWRADALQCSFAMFSRKLILLVVLMLYLLAEATISSTCDGSCASQLVCGAHFVLRPLQCPRCSRWRACQATPGYSLLRDMGSTLLRFGSSHQGEQCSEETVGSVVKYRP